MVFRESSKGTVKSINMTKSSIEESTIYQYITLPVSGNYTVTAHDIVDGTIISNPSVVYPQVLEYILYHLLLRHLLVCTCYQFSDVLLYGILLGTSRDKIVSLDSDTNSILTFLEPSEYNASLNILSCKYNYS